MWSVPVPVHDVCLSVPVEVCQSDPSAVLHGVLHTYRYKSAALNKIHAHERSNSQSRFSFIPLTSLLRHICESSIPVVPEQEVGPVLVVAEHVGQRLTNNGPHHDASPSCTHRETGASDDRENPDI